MSNKIIEECLKNRISLVEKFEWCIMPNVVPNLITKNLNQESNIQEKKWGNIMNNTENNNQWTTKLGEIVVRDFFKYVLGKNIWKPIKISGYQPDWETDDEIIEVKTRNWTTSGTAGEKVLGCPYKYSDINRLYGKKLKIILVAYQEYEYTYGNTRLFGNDISKEKQKLLNTYKELGIEFIKFSDLLFKRI